MIPVSPKRVIIKISNFENYLETANFSIHAASLRNGKDFCRPSQSTN
jgi:hypothetical protein